MIFRDIRTGALLNIRRDEYTNDSSYFREIRRIAGAGAGAGASANTHEVIPYYSKPYDEVISEQQRKQMLQ
jgi:hypothetical protein